MTETVLPTPEVGATSPPVALEPAAPQPITPERVAEIMAARLCHDFMSPASGIVSGLDFLGEGDEAMRAEAMKLIAASAHKLMDMLTFYRVAVGGFAEGEDFDTRQLETLARGVFAHVRPELEWAVDMPALPGDAARILLNLTYIAAGSLALGGVARVSVRRENGWLALIVQADGARARLQPEVAVGLKGESLAEGLPGRWILAWGLHAQVSAAGGAVAAEVGEGGVMFKAVLPA